MPPKRDGVIDRSEVGKLLKSEMTKKAAIIRLQVAAGDRVDDPRLRILNQTDEARGWEGLSGDEWSEIDDIVMKLVRAAAARLPTAQPKS